MANLTPFPIRDFTAGEASIFPISKMPFKYSMKLQNCHISLRGGIAKVPGYTKINSSTVTNVIKTGWEFKKTDGTTQILCAGGGKIWKVAGAGLTEIKTGLDSSAKVSFATMKNLCIMVNGVDAPMKYDGTTVSALGGTPPATAFKVHVHKGRVWFLERTNVLLATHSALDDPEDYTTADDAGFLDFQYVLRRGGELLDIGTYVDLLIFYFRNTIVIYSGSDPTASGDFAIAQLIEGAGVVDTGTIEGLGTDLALLYDSGVKSLKQIVTTGNLNMNDLSEAIDPTIRSQILSGSNFSSAHYPSQGWYLLLIGTTIWVYSYTWKAWGRIVGADVNGMFSTASGDLYYCGTGFLYQVDPTVSDFAGVNPAMLWETAWFAFSGKGYKVYPKRAEIITYPFATATITLEMKYDMNLSPATQYTTFDTAPDNLTLWDGVADFDAWTNMDEIPYSKVEIPLFGSGRNAQMIFSNTSDKQVEIDDIIIYGEIGGR